MTHGKTQKNTSRILAGYGLKFASAAVLLWVILAGIYHFVPIVIQIRMGIDVEFARGFSQIPVLILMIPLGFFGGLLSGIIIETCPFIPHDEE